MTAGFIPISPTGFQQNSHQFNISLQNLPTYQQNRFQSPYQSINPNSSMSTNSTKYIPNSISQVQPPANINNFVGPSFIKPHGYIAEVCSSNHQSFNSNININAPLSPNVQVYNWKKN
jgi:hypothetical protein